MSKSANERFKRYESSYNLLIPPRTYTIVRVDGKGFSKFTKSMNKPFDEDFSEAMNYAAIELCKEFNPDFAYTQSDEISLVFTDFAIEAQQMFDGKIQKLCSTTAAKAAASFNKKLLMIKAEKCFQSETFDLEELKNNTYNLMRDISHGQAVYDTMFDSRVFIIPDFREVGNYFVWRQQDATRNSISMAAEKVVGKKAIVGKNGSQRQEMMFEKGVNWNDYKTQFKRGVVIVKEEFEMDAPKSPTGKVMRKRWVVDEDTPIFTKNREYLNSLIQTIPCPDLEN
jgi:tRNA(His) 5'-end guanylyltransferase